MRRYITVIFFIFYPVFSVFSQNYTIIGKVLDNVTKEPVEFATVTLPFYDLWAVSGKDGSFVIRQVPVGKTTIIASYIGYAKYKLDIDVRKDIGNLTLTLSEDNLALSEVTVTANVKKVMLRRPIYLTVPR